VPALALAPMEPGRLEGERVLDDVVLRAWEELTAHRRVACAVCGGEMNPVYGAQARPIGGVCTSCGSRLS
jgi:hypothetical protein